MQTSFDFATRIAATKASSAGAPRGYKGLYALHKYWGKKPFEPLAYLIEALTCEAEVVMDPFAGTGGVLRESLLRSRKAIGFDINPAAIQIANLLCHPPTVSAFRNAVDELNKTLRPKIEETYLLADGTTTATHFLWDVSVMKRVWVAPGKTSKRRLEFEPSANDIQCSRRFNSYESRTLRQPQFFTNGRINAAPQMRRSDLFTGRAQYNIDLIIHAVAKFEPPIRDALRLCLTAASGQMSRMVFAVTNRGKTSGEISDKVEVGSWVIGYWRPRLHFEVNVWNTFARRLNKMLKALQPSDPLADSVVGASPNSVFDSNADACVKCGDARTLLRAVPSESVHLIVTDPPHGDRVPYLELSEMWNSILGYDVDFESELVVSNAKERGKTPAAYFAGMESVFLECSRVLRDSGHLVVIFNAADAADWAVFAPLLRENCGLRYTGYFDCTYSATSVVQDNRSGSLKKDLALVFRKSNGEGRRPSPSLFEVPGWTTSLPEPLQTLVPTLCR